MPANEPDAPESLDARMLAAHANCDLVGLVDLYTRAADMSEAQGNIDAACFYLTQAFVFALDFGAAEAQTLHARLKTHGREA
ncbi:MAG: hypothetical protein ACU0DI_14460 [Paracoccaceae bacterium]